MEDYLKTNGFYLQQKLVNFNLRKEKLGSLIKYNLLKTLIHYQTNLFYN